MQTTESSAFTTQGPYKGWPAIILFGDSITEGIWHQDSFSFGAALSNEFSRRIQVLERGFSGYNASNARVIVDDVIPPVGGSLDLKLLVIFFGANDAAMPGCFQHVDMAEYKEHIKAFATHPHVKEHGAKVIIVTPPPICEHKTYPSNDRKNAVTRQYADAAIAVAEETGSAVVDLWHVFMEHAGWKEGDPLLGEIGTPKSKKLEDLLSDGLHLTGKGYQLYYDTFMSVLEEKLPEIHNYKRGYPNWADAPRYEGKM